MRPLPTLRSTLAWIACIAGIAGIVGTQLGACSSQQLFATGQQWQRSECLKIEDRAERQRCELGAAGAYDSYKAQAESLKKP